jgi:hypothetical protein
MSILREASMKRAPDWRQQVAESTTHARLLLHIVTYLKLTGWFVIVTPKGGIPGMPGMPDLWALKAGRVMFVEVKVGRDKMSVDQLRVAAELEERGYPVLEARSLDDVMREAA